MENKKLKCFIEFAENGVILRHDDFAAEVYENDNDDVNDGAIKAIGGHIFYTLLGIMEDSGPYKFNVNVDIECLED